MYNSYSYCFTANGEYRHHCLYLKLLKLIPRVPIKKKECLFFLCFANSIYFNRLAQLFPPVSELTSIDKELIGVTRMINVMYGTGYNGCKHF